MKKILGIIVIALGLASGALFYQAGTQFKESASDLREHGKELTYLRSKGGTTVAEAYYQEIGRYGISFAGSWIGCSYFSYALGMGVLALSTGLGINLITKSEN
jgi:ABC-type Na+ efflux pump permease subunit